MSIAELIMQGTNRASESTAWVGDSLAKLGQNVGKVLADREQQKQAQEMLPMFQQNMQDAMTYANEGDSGLAFSKLMPFLTNPATLKNPYILPALDAGTKMIELAANDYARNIQVEAYRDRYSGGGGGGGGDGDVTTILDALNQDGDSEYDGGVIEQPDIYSQAGSQGKAFPFKQAVGQTTQPQGMPAINQPLQGTPEQQAMQRQDMDARMVEVPLHGEEQAPLAQGPVRKEEPPSQKTLKRFTQLQDYFNSLPLKEQKYKMDQTSVIFKDQDAISSYKPPKGTGVVELDKAAGIGVPDAFAVQLPAKVSKYVLGSVSVGKSGVRYNIDNKIQGDAEAKDAIKWLEDWQSASVAVGSNPQLRGLLSQAGNDALNIDISDAPINDDSEDGGKMIELQVRDKPDTKIQVPESAGKLVQMLQAQTSAANTHNAKFLRLKQAKPTAEAPAQPQKERFPDRNQPTPQATPQPPAGIPAGDWQKLTPAERERIMSERIRGAIGTGVGAVMRGGKAILRGARSIR